MNESHKVLRMVADVLAANLAKTEDRDAIYIVAREIAEAQRGNDPYFDDEAFFRDATRILKPAVTI